MRPRYRLLIPLVLFLLLAPTAVLAGWGDALKQTGSEYADQGATAAGLPYTPSEAVTGIKEVLTLGTDYATSSLSQPGGFSTDSATTFSLPGSLSDLSGSANLLSALNSAGEDAVPGTGNIFLDAIQNLAVSDYSTLLNGGNDAITRFFESSTRDTLRKMIRPVVGQSVESAGVNDYLAPMMAAQSATGVSGPAFDATDYVTDRVLDGMFFYMGVKEQEIRSAGGVGTSDLLQKLF